MQKLLCLYVNVLIPYIPLLWRDRKIRRTINEASYLWTIDKYSQYTKLLLTYNNLNVPVRTLLCHVIDMGKKLSVKNCYIRFKLQSNCCVCLMFGVTNTSRVAAINFHVLRSTVPYTRTSLYSIINKLNMYFVLVLSFLLFKHSPNWRPPLELFIMTDYVP